MDEQSESPVLGEVLDWSEGGQVASRARRAPVRGPQSRAHSSLLRSEHWL